MRKARVWSVGALMALAACSGGDDGGDGGTGPAVFTTLDVQPASASVTVNGTQQLTPTAKDQNNATMSGLTTTYQSSDVTKATVTPTGGLVTGVAVGTATITATGTVGTVTKTKTVNITVANPTQNASVAATGSNSFDPASVSILPGGSVTWTFAIEHNVTFSGTLPTGGNIPNTTTGSVSRTFPTAGTYNYTCTLHAGMSGTVRVQ